MVQSQEARETADISERRETKADREGEIKTERRRRALPDDSERP